MTPEAISIPQEVRDRILSVGPQVSKDEIDVYQQYREIEDRSYKLRTVLEAWERQHGEERQMRRTYAKWLLLMLFSQILLINAAFFLIGFKWLDVQQWTATTFIIAAFTEIAGMSLFVVKYLFPELRSEVLQLLEKL